MGCEQLVGQGPHRARVVVFPGEQCAGSVAVEVTPPFAVGVREGAVRFGKQYDLLQRLPCACGVFLCLRRRPCAECAQAPGVGKQVFQRTSRVFAQRIFADGKLGFRAAGANRQIFGPVVHVFQQGQGTVLPAGFVGIGYFRCELRPVGAFVDGQVLDSHDAVKRATVHVDGPLVGFGGDVALRGAQLFALKFACRRYFVQAAKDACA